MLNFMHDYPHVTFQIWNVERAYILRRLSNFFIRSRLKPSDGSINLDGHRFQNQLRSKPSDGSINLAGHYLEN